MVPIMYFNTLIGYLFTPALHLISASCTNNKGVKKKYRLLMCVKAQVAACWLPTHRLRFLRGLVRKLDNVRINSEGKLCR